MYDENVDASDQQGKLFDPAQSKLTFDPDELRDSETDEAMRYGNMLYLGHCYLQFLKQSGVELQFDSWLINVKEAARDYELVATDNEWLWAWESLRQSNSVAKKFGKLRAAKARWKSSRDRFECLPAGAEFGVAIKQSELEHLRSCIWSSDFTPRVSVTAKSALSLKPGKADRLDCCDAACEVTIKIEGSLGKEREADVMRITPDEIVSLSDTSVRVKAKERDKGVSRYGGSGTVMGVERTFRGLPFGLGHLCSPHFVATHPINVTSSASSTQKPASPVHEQLLLSALAPSMMTSYVCVSIWIPLSAFAS